MNGAGTGVLRAAGVGTADGDLVLCRDVSFTVPAASAFALVGEPRATGSLLECFAGKRRASTGTMTVLGLDSSSRWKLRSRRLYVPSGSPVPDLGAARHRPDVLLLEDPALPEAETAATRRAVSDGMTLLLTTTRAAVAEGLADAVGILVRGRLLASGPLEAVVAGFRRITFLTRATETRTAFGTELDEFDAVRVRVRGWGIEAVVSNFDAAAFQRLSASDGVSDAAARSLSLAEILEACGIGG